MLKSWILLLFAILLIGLPSIALASSSSVELSDIEVVNQESGCMMSGNPRKLKGTRRNEINMEDYGRVDPSPTTKASIKPGPIQHGSPLNPYIPKPPPPFPAHPEDSG